MVDGNNAEGGAAAEATETVSRKPGRRKIWRNTYGPAAGLEAYFGKSFAELDRQGFPVDRLRQGGMTVETTIDRRAQRASETVVRNRLAGERDYLRASLVSVGRNGPGMAVGDYRIRPFDMAVAYATFAADGLRAEPHFVQRVRAENGAIVWERSLERTPAFRISGRTGDRNNSQSWIASQLTEALRVVGTGRTVELAGGHPAAAKAGTHRFTETGDSDAAWMVGYTPRVCTAVWVGANRDRRLRDANNEKINGQTLPADIWRSFMDTYHEGRKVKRFPEWPDERIYLPGPPDIRPPESLSPNPEIAEDSGQAN